jgi:hypothetical protein
MFACKTVATGVRGVVVSIESLSFKDPAESVREALERRRKDIVVGVETR